MKIKGTYAAAIAAELCVPLVPFSHTLLPSPLPEPKPYATYSTT